MPGEKRKCDEDTWIVTQSKKFKCGQLISNVYATTLAQLRLGARNFFRAADAVNSEDGLQSPNGSFGPSSPVNTPPPSPVIRDLISHNDLSPSSPTMSICPDPRDICQNCAYKKEGWEKCYYCEKVVCHVNPCAGCQYGFCSNCCITKYDNPTDAYVCYGCLH